MKTLKDKINEAFFKNVEAAGKERLFLYDLKNNLDKWKTSANMDSLINILDRFCSKAKSENYDFVIYIGSETNTDSVVLCKFFHKYYETPGTEDNTSSKDRSYNRCWKVNLMPTSMLNSADTFNPPAGDKRSRKFLDTVSDFCKFIISYINQVGSKKDITFKVRMSLDSSTCTNWI